jgi:hypothetical protein
VEGELLAFHPHVVRNHHTIRLNWNRLFVLSVCSFPFCSPRFLDALFLLLGAKEEPTPRPALNQHLGVVWAHEAGPTIGHLTHFALAT